MAEGNTGLRRSIGLWRASAIVSGIIIGASIFAQPSEIIKAVPSEAAAIAVWFGAGILTLIGALVIAELASAWPASGGVYVFLKRAYSPVWGFLWGWAMFWSMHTGIVAIIAMIFARYFGAFVTLDANTTKAVAVGGVLALSAVNYIGVRQGSALQAALTAVKIVALSAIIVIAFTMGTPVAATPTEPGAVTTNGIFEALIAGLFTYGGWHMVSYTAEETVDPTRTIPKALMIGTLGVTVLYVFANAAYLHVMTPAQVGSSTRVAADMADAIFGPAGGRIVAVAVMISALGAMNGVILAGPRVYQAMAADGLLFKWAAEVHPEFRTPHRAIAMQAVWAVVLILTGTFGMLVRRVVYTEWIFFAMLALALFLMRRKPDYTPAYRAWGYPVLPAIFIVSSLAIVVNRLIHDTREGAIGLAIVAAGLPVYLLWSRKHQPRP